MLNRAFFDRNLHIRINAKYVRSHSSVYLNVALRQFDAGGGVQKTFLQQPKRIRDKLRVIHQSEHFNPHPIAAHPRVDPAVRKQITRALLELGHNRSGAALLAKIPILKIGTSSVNDYQAIKALKLDSYYVNE